MNDIHDIKPLLELPFPWLSAAIWGGLALTILIAAFWAWHRWRKKPAQSQEQTRQKPKISAREQSLNALDKLKAAQLDSPEFYFELEKILRTFLAETHQLPITSYTREELLLFLRTQPQTATQTFAADALLLRGQQAKFAAESIGVNNQQLDLQQVQNLVRHYTLA